MAAIRTAVTIIAVNDRMKSIDTNSTSTLMSRKENAFPLTMMSVTKHWLCRKGKKLGQSATTAMRWMIDKGGTRRQQGNAVMVSHLKMFVFCKGLLQFL